MIDLFVRGRRRHREYLRQIDCVILWQSICAEAANEVAARDAFFFHCIVDPLWNEVPLPIIVKTVAELPYGPQA